MKAYVPVRSNPSTPPTSVYLDTRLSHDDRRVELHSTVILLSQSGLNIGNLFPVLIKQISQDRISFCNHGNLYLNKSSHCSRRLSGHSERKETWLLGRGGLKRGDCISGLTVPLMNASSHVALISSHSSKLICVTKVPVPEVTVDPFQIASFPFHTLV